MLVFFRAIEEFDPGPGWQAEFERLRPGYQRWFRLQGDAARPPYLTCARALREHMPELMPTYERLVDIAGGGDQVARLLSLYRPTPYLTGCSQAVWTRGTPLLARNYDYSPRLWDATLWHTRWHERGVIGMSDCLWGVLDGINEDGLCVSLAFGGSKAVGDGFGMPLVLRYVLEFCRTTREAVAVLCRVPSHMAYNITMLDAEGKHATVFVSPQRPALVTRRPMATNHQREIEWTQYAHATATLDRERVLAAHLSDPHESPERSTRRFTEPPLYSHAFEQGWGTLYTAMYRPDEARAGATGSADFLWPGYTLRQSFADFTPLALTLDYSAPSP